MYAYNVIFSVIHVCVTGAFARGREVRCACNVGNSKFCSQITGTSPVMSVYFFSHAISADWRVNKYKFIMITLIKKTE